MRDEVTIVDDDTISTKLANMSVECATLGEQLMEGSRGIRNGLAAHDMLALLTGLAISLRAAGMEDHTHARFLEAHARRLREILQD